MNYETDFTINQFKERVYKWENTKHPDNPNFMQTVLWRMWVKPNGNYLIGYKLDYNGKMKYFYPMMTAQEAFEKYS